MVRGGDGEGGRRGGRGEEEEEEGRGGINIRSWIYFMLYLYGCLGWRGGRMHAGANARRCVAVAVRCALWTVVAMGFGFGSAGGIGGTQRVGA